MRPNRVANGKINYELSTRARTAVQRAIKEGLFSKASDHACVDCGKPAACYDHRDYARPLDVQPVCRSCNAYRGTSVRHDKAALVAVIEWRRAWVGKTPPPYPAINAKPAQVAA